MYLSAYSTRMSARKFYFKAVCTFDFESSSKDGRGQYGLHTYVKCICRTRSSSSSKTKIAEKRRDIKMHPHTRTTAFSPSNQSCAFFKSKM